LSGPVPSAPRLPLTRTPIRFELTFDVAQEDIDRLGHVNNVVYLRWIQDVAARHWLTTVGEEETRGTVWVVVRHEIDYVQPAGPGDRVIARTWVGEARGATWDRHTEIVRASDGQVLARARSVWCPLNAETRRPRRLSPELRAGFYEGS
jgi:acyl-CoA thioester hydrolase